MTITPNAMPNKTIGAQILSALIKTKPESWVRKTVDPASTDPKKPLIIETKVTNTVLRFPLAGNVSALNVERAARKLVA